MGDARIDIAHGSTHLLRPINEYDFFFPNPLARSIELRASI
jgi:hypothetical protein